MRIGANTDRQAIAAVPRMSPLKKYIGSAENEKCAMEKHIAEKSTAESEPNARYSERIMPRKNSSSHTAGTSTNATIISSMLVFS